MGKKASCIFFFFCIPQISVSVNYITLKKCWSFSTYWFIIQNVKILQCTSLQQFEITDRQTMFTVWRHLPNKIFQNSFMKLEIAYKLNEWLTGRQETWIWIADITSIISSHRGSAFIGGQRGQHCMLTNHEVSSRHQQMIVNMHIILLAWRFTGGSNSQPCH